MPRRVSLLAKLTVLTIALPVLVLVLSESDWIQIMHGKTIEANHRTHIVVRVLTSCACRW